MTQKEINEVARSIRRDLDGGLILQRNSGAIQDCFLNIIDKFNEWYDVIESSAKHKLISTFLRNDLHQILSDTLDEQIFWLAEAAVEQKEGK